MSAARLGCVLKQARTTSWSLKQEHSKDYLIDRLSKLDLLVNEHLVITVANMAANVMAVNMLHRRQG